MKKQYELTIIENIIYEFSKINLETSIKPFDIYEFSNKLFKENKIPYKLSYDFWRKPQYLGKQLILKTNKTFELNEIEAQLEVNNALSDIDLELNSRKQLLVVMDVLKKQKNENKELEDRLLNAKKKIEFLEIQNEKYMKTLFSLIAASSYSNNEFFSILKGNPSNNVIIRNLFDNIFEEDKNLENEFIKYLIDIHNNTLEKSKNIVAIKKGRLNKLLDKGLNK